MDIIRQHIGKFLTLFLLTIAVIASTVIASSADSGDGNIRETALVRGDISRAIMRSRFGDDTLDVLTYINQSLGTTSDAIVPYDGTFKDSGRTKSIQFKDLAHETVYVVKMTAPTTNYDKQIIISCPPESAVKQTCSTGDEGDY